MKRSQVQVLVAPPNIARCSGSLTQLVECLLCKQDVGSSILPGSTDKKRPRFSGGVLLFPAVVRDMVPAGGVLGGCAPAGRGFRRRCFGARETCLRGGQTGDARRRRSAGRSARLTAHGCPGGSCGAPGAAGARSVWAEPGRGAAAGERAARRCHDRQSRACGKDIHRFIPIVDKLQPCNSCHSARLLGRFITTCPQALGRIWGGGREPRARAPRL